MVYGKTHKPEVLLCLSFVQKTARESQPLNRVCVLGHIRRTGKESTMADASPRTDISTDVDTDEKNQRVRTISLFYFILLLFLFSLSLSISIFLFLGVCYFTLYEHILVLLAS